MKAPNPNKRFRTVPSISFSSSGQIQNPNPNSFLNVPDFNQNHVDLTISSFLSLHELPSLSSSVSIGYSFDRALEKLFESSGDDCGHDRLTDRSIELASLLQESAKRCYRKRATLHNSVSWPLPCELTVKVFSILDTKSLMQASACCTMFNKCAMDPLCYSHIDLTTGYVDDKAVRNMVRHADKELRSLKLGHVPCLDESTTSLLTEYCLNPLFINQGFSGNLLRSLHLYHHKSLDPESLSSAMSACSNLIDFKIVVCERDDTFVLDEVLEFLSNKCQHLFIEKEITSDRSTYIYSSKLFWRNLPDLTSLSLIGFLLEDSEASLLIQGFRKLKYLNLSKTLGINGRFLSNDWRDTLLDTIILRDCIYQEESKVLLFLNSLPNGNFRSIRHIDISKNQGLISDSGIFCKPKFSLENLKKERPSVTFVADFTSNS